MSAPLRLGRADLQSLLLFAAAVTAVTVTGPAAAQIRAALAIILTGVITMATASHWFDRRTGLLSGCVIVTLSGLFVATRGDEALLWLLSATSVTLAAAARFELSRPLESHSRLQLVNTTPLLLLLASVTLATIAGGDVTGLCGFAVPLTVFCMSCANRLTFRSCIAALRNHWSWLAAAGTVGAITSATSGTLPEPGWTLMSVSPASVAPFASVTERALLPWLPAVACGLWMTRHEALGGGPTHERLLWCWSIATPVSLLAVAPGQPHSVLIVSPAWAIACGITLSRISQQLFEVVTEAERQAARRIAARLAFATAVVLCCLTGLVNEPREIGIGAELRPEIPNQPAHSPSMTGQMRDAGERTPGIATPDTSSPNATRLAVAPDENEF